MTSSSTICWAERTWEEIPGDLANVANAALLPVGATEQHGPHLGCGMDYVLADAVAKAVSERIGVPILPTLPYGCSLGHSRRWPGTIALDPVLLTNLVSQIGSQAYHSGVRRLFIVNAHVTNAAPLRSALEILRATHDDIMVAVINTATMSTRVRDAHFADAEDWHANRAETALMLAVAPGLVRKNRIADADDEDRTVGLVFAHPVNRTSKNGVTGRPSEATSDQGAELFSWMVEDLSALVRRGLTEMPPLPHSYNDSVFAS
ncbi:MAG: creatininase family protein [Xanthobacteraceae bacterium]|nr:creatininase family protein [Xanthobacteraceae bacterium]